MNDYHHFNRPDLLEDHFKEKDMLGIVEGYRLAFDKLETLSIVTGKGWNELVHEASQLSVETGISFVDAAEKVREKYLR